MLAAVEHTELLPTIEQQLRAASVSFETLSPEVQVLLRSVDVLLRANDAEVARLRTALASQTGELQQALSEMRATIDALPDLFIRIDTEGAILDYRLGHSAVVNLPPEIPFVKRIQDIPKVGRKFADALHAVRTSRALIAIEYQLTSREQTYSYEARFLPLGEEQFIVIIRDITERARAEQQTRNAVQQKEVLLQEVHHRVKNNLQIISSLLSLQAEHVRNAHDRALFTESQNRVRAIALLHESLYKSKDFTHIDIPAYLRSLVGSVFQTTKTGTGKVSYELDLEDINLDLDSAIPCGLIVGELVANSLQHAFPRNRAGTIKVRFKRLKGGLLLRVSDNGIGVKPAKRRKSAESLGLELVKALARQLNGSVSMRYERGTATSIRFTREVSAQERS